MVNIVSRGKGALIGNIEHQILKNKLFIKKILGVPTIFGGDCSLYQADSLYSITSHKWFHCIVMQTKELWELPELNYSSLSIYQCLFPSVLEF